MYLCGISANVNNIFGLFTTHAFTNSTLGILPVGGNNHMAKRLCPDRIMDMNGSVPLMAEAAMNVIKRVYRPVDVMEVKIKDEDTTKKLRPLYGLREVCIICSLLVHRFFKD